MLNLSTKLVLDDKTILAANLCDKFSKEDLQTIGNEVHQGYLIDKQSRFRWERRVQAAMDLALQVQKEKNFPWPGASNIAFPLVSIAAVQFHSRAYPALISGPDIVKCRVIGGDPTGEATKRASRISTHMSWQCMDEDKAWVEQKDRLLINLAIVGTVFTKSYWNVEKAHRVDETVLAQDLVLNYWSKSVESCPRKTHVIPLQKNQLYSNMKRKIFRDVSEESWYGKAAQPQQLMPQARRDTRQGLNVPETDQTTPYISLEQHVEIDLDQDGYAEPYIITIEESSKSVLRIVSGVDRPEDIERTKAGEIISCRATQYFTKYSFIPSPDNGIYDVGFGIFLGPLNESVNSIINQLTDTGTMQNTKGGFLGRGAKIRGGVYTFAPLEWKRVDSSGDDLRKNIVPLEVGEPSMVLFNLLNLLIGYVNRLAGTTDPVVGENPGQNTPAETMRTMVDQGLKIYSSIYKRVWNSMKEEFKKDYILNGLFMPRRKTFGSGLIVLREDYLGNPDEVIPEADPNVTSDQMALAQVQLLKQSAATTPGYDIEEVERRFLKALKVSAIDQVYPGIKKTGVPKDTKIQIQELKNEAAAQALQAEQMRWMVEIQEEYRINSAEIAKIAAEIQNMKDVSQGDVADRQVAIMQSVMKLLDSRNQGLLGRLEIVKKQLEVQRERIKTSAAAADRRDVRRLAPASGNGDSSAGAEPATEAA